MDISWDDLRFFAAAFEAGSFSAAAGALGVGQATVSRRIAALEETVGHSLFDRLPTGLVATAAGELLVPYVETMRAGARDVTSAISGLEVAPTGVVKLAAPPGAAVDLVPVIVPEMWRHFPDIRIDILSDTLTRDLTRHEADVALRSIRPESGDLLVRKLLEADLGLWASERYVASLPKRVKLEHLDFIGWSEELAHIPMAQWIDAHKVRPYRITTNSFIAMRAAAVADLGVVLIPGVQARLVGLVPVPIRVPSPPQIPTFVVIHRAMRHVPRIKVVVALVVDALTALVRGEDIQKPGWWTPPRNL